MPKHENDDGLTMMEWMVAAGFDRHIRLSEIPDDAITAWKKNASADAWRQRRMDESKTGPIPDCVLRLLKSSWRDIGFGYAGLTPEEKKCISEREFNAIVPHVKAAK